MNVRPSQTHPWILCSLQDIQVVVGYRIILRKIVQRLEFLDPETLLHGQLSIGQREASILAYLHVPVVEVII